MPDWLTHVVIALFFAELFRIEKKSLVVLGALLPDFLSKLHLIFFYLGISEYLTFSLLHTPMMVFLVILLIAPLFRYSQKKVVLWLGLGAVTHFVFDVTMRHFEAGMHLFYPFTFTMYSLNWIWPNDSFYLMGGSLLAYFLLLLYRNNGKAFRNVFK